MGSYWRCFGDELMIQGVVPADTVTVNDPGRFWALGERMMIAHKNGLMEAWLYAPPPACVPIHFWRFQSAA
jgi:hypothetical protein